MAESTRKSAAIRVALALAVLLIVVCNISPSAPIWKWNDDTANPASEENLLARYDEKFLAAADGGNLGMRFTGFDTADLHQSLWMCAIYYRAVYTLYPRQVFVSDTSRIINTEVEQSAVNLPDDRWLAAHDARAVCEVQYQGGDVQIDVRSISKD